MFRVRSLTLMVLAMLVGLSAGGVIQESSTAQERPPLPAGVEALARLLATVADQEESGDTTPDPTIPDPATPAVGLRLVIGDIEALLGRRGMGTAMPLEVALASAEDAWSAFAAGSEDLSHLRRTTSALHRAQIALRLAMVRGGPDTDAAATRIQEEITEIAERLADSLVRRARSAGVAPRRLTAALRLHELGLRAAGDGRHEVAVVHFGGALALAANTVTFDVALFEQNIKDALAGNTVGHAFSIAYQGLLYQGGESSGLARTAADAPITNQSPSKEQHVASVSKTLTAIVLLRLLEQNGLTPDDFVAPYVPSNWVLSAGAEGLRFRHFLTHASGFGQIAAGNSYTALQTAMANVAGFAAFDYQNGNFGMMRVLISGLQGIDPVDYGEFDAAGLTTAAFLLYAQSMYDAIGVEVSCAPNDVTPTIQYRFPDDETSGYEEPDHQLSCGGFGWFISSSELASVLTNLHNTENLISAESRTLMRENFYGFMDPANYGFIGGDFGVYSMHGGDWRHSGYEAHACAMVFPIAVEVGLVINSARGPAMAYQCALLQTAFDESWVAN